MSDLKSINLTQKDFKLILDGLEFLPHKSASMELMGGLLTSLLAPDEESMKKALDSRKKKMEDQEAEKELLIEEIRILQGKLLMLKRYLMENKLLDDTNAIINAVK